MRLLRHLFAHKGALFLVFVLLSVQAFADLALPNLTSQIVDVGIQQSGIEHVTVEDMSARTFERVCALVSPDDERMVRDSYEQAPDGTYALTDYGREHLGELDRVLAVPLIIIHRPETLPETDWAQMMDAYDAGEITHDDLIRHVDEAKERLSADGEGILDQQGIAAARAEYEQLGYDLTGMQMGYFLRVGSLMLGLAAVVMTMSILVGFISSRTGAKIGYELRTKLFRRVVSFTENEIEKFSAASLITRGTNDIQLIQMVCIMSMRMVLYAPILAIGGIIMVMVTNASLGWIIVVAIVVLFALLAVVFGVAMPKFRIMQKLIDKVNLVAREMLTGLPVVRAFDREDFEEQRFDEASTHLMKTQLFTNRVMAFMMPSIMLIMNVVSVAIVWFGGISIDNGVLQTGDLIAFITYAMVIIMGFNMIGMISIMLPRADVAARRIDEVLACEPVITDPAAGERMDLDGNRPVAGAALAFNDVTFAYGDSDEPVLSHVSFTVNPGETLAIIGATGSGKSTVLKLIERFHDVKEGSVTIDGVDIRRLSQRDLCAQFGYVPQKAFLFSGTVKSNVAYGDPDLDDGDVWEALSIAQAAGFVEEREEGLESPIAQGGTNVSGGQRQRLAIARALATHPRVFLFDDSFSALDYKTDAALRHELDHRLAGATKIIVAQRISTIMHADHIVVLDEGEVVGRGTHDELMRTCEEYREIASSQLSADELEQGVADER